MKIVEKLFLENNFAYVLLAF